MEAYMRLLIMAGLMLASAVAFADDPNHAVTVYPAPEGAPVSKDYEIMAGGKAVPVFSVPSKYKHPVCFASFDFTGRIQVVVKPAFLPEERVSDISLHPLSRGILPRQDGAQASFDLEKPGSVTVIVNGDRYNRPLHIFANPPAEPAPEGAIVFGPGLHKTDLKKPIVLNDGQTLCLAGGAWVEGWVQAKNATGIRIMGRGVLSQTSRTVFNSYHKQKIGPRGIDLLRCRDVVIEGITLTRSVPQWCTVLSDCDRVRVSYFHVVAPVVPSTDGLNPCNSRDVIIEDCFFRTGDDCISIKGKGGRTTPPEKKPPVENITVSRCVLWSDANNALVVGPETRARHYQNIEFRDCDVIHKEADWKEASVFSILSLHGTRMSNIVFDDLRVEHARGRLFLFGFIDSVFNIPGNHTFPGEMAGITIRNIHLAPGIRSKSDFRGWAADKQVRDVTIEGLRSGHEVVRDANSMGLSMNRFVSNVRFVNPPAGKVGQPRRTQPDPEAGPFWLTFGSGFHSEDGQRSTGVRIQVQVWEQGSDEKVALLDEHVRPGPAWREHAVNLSAWSGKKAVVRFIVAPGLDTHYDHFFWGAPSVIRCTRAGRDVLLDTAGIYRQADKGLLAWPHGKLLPVGAGANVRLHAGPKEESWLRIGNDAKPGIFLHPAWKHGRFDPVYVEWVMDLRK
jgi:hypothetical protein